ncbi:MAG: glycoside hydrolase family 18 protein, partial [Planctomycetia bacterium]
TSAQVTVPVLGDATVESDETFSLVLSAPQNATLAQASASATIRNDDTTTVTPGPTDITRFDKAMTAYFPEWGIYDRKFQVADVPADKLNHLIYSFLNLKSDGQVAIYDTYAALEKRFAADETVSGQAEQYYYPPGDPRATQTVWGNFNQLAELKAKYPHMKVSIAVGGWTLSGNFSTVCSTAAGRETDATSLTNFLNTYRMFDGIDFDWEYPGGGGLDGNSSSPSDGANYAKLLQLVRQKFDALGGQLGRRYEISVASPAGTEKIAAFNLAGLAPFVDLFNVMSYDFHGTWESTTGHQSAFTGDANGYDVKTAIAAYLAAGVPARKIVLGAPLYTRGWSGVADGGDGGYLEKAAGPAPGTFEKGVYDYKDLLGKVQDPAQGWKLYWDDRSQAAYVYNAAQGIFSSFETPTSIAQRSQWAEDIGLGGMMFWDISNDAVDAPESLVTAAYRSWVIDEDLATIRGRSQLTKEAIIGGDGIIAPLPLTV